MSSATMARCWARPTAGTLGRICNIPMVGHRFPQFLLDEKGTVPVKHFEPKSANFQFFLDGAQAFSRFAPKHTFYDRVELVMGKIILGSVANVENDRRVDGKNIDKVRVGFLLGGTWER